MNLHNRLRALVAPGPLLYGTVVAVDNLGALVELPEGAQVRARGSVAVNDTVWLRDGVIEGLAPAGLTYIAQQC